VNTNQIVGAALVFVGMTDVGMVSTVLRGRLEAAPGGGIVRNALIVGGLATMAAGGLFLAGVISLP